MSFSENYDKVALGVGGVLALAGLGLGLSSHLSLDETYKVDTTISDREVEIPGIDQSMALEKILTDDHTIARPKVGEKEQQTFDMFVAPVLWLKTGDTVPIDIYSGPPIHPPIPNTWFLENKLAADLSWSDALNRDADKDGFTNLEEFEAKTAPNDSSKHPLLVTKLGVSEMSAIGYFVAFSSDAMAPDYTFKGLHANGTTLWKADVKVGATMPEENPKKKVIHPNRFKLVEVTKKTFESKAGPEEDAVAIVEDTKETKKGTKYEIRKTNKYKQPIQDRSVTFSVLAGTKNGETFKVEEGATFKIPGDDKTQYKLQSVDLKQKTAIVTQEGSDKTWKIQ